MVEMGSCRIFAVAGLELIHVDKIQKGPGGESSQR
jgi:hypothetical protein